MRTLADIDAEMIKLRTVREEAQARLRVLAHERDLVVAAEKVAALPEAERQVLLQIVAAQGIASGEAVGRPGAG